MPPLPGGGAMAAIEAGVDFNGPEDRGVALEGGAFPSEALEASINAPACGSDQGGVQSVLLADDSCEQQPGAWCCSTDYVQARFSRAMVSG